MWSSADRSAKRQRRRPRVHGQWRILKPRRRAAGQKSGSVSVSPRDGQCEGDNEEAAEVGPEPERHQQPAHDCEGARTEYRNRRERHLLRRARSSAPAENACGRDACGYSTGVSVSSRG
jgi:hypothetical protein